MWPRIIATGRRLGSPEKETLLYTIEASMSMITNDSYCTLNARRALTPLAVGETYGEMIRSSLLPRPWRGRIQPLRGWRDLIAGTFRRFHLRLMILGPFGTRRKRVVQRLWAVPQTVPGFLRKRFFFYTIEASMSMTIHEAFCTIRENELPQSHPNDTKFAKKCCLFALFARWVQSMKTIPLVHLLVGGRLAVPDEPGRASPTPTRFQTGLLSLALAIIALTTCHQAMAESQTVWQIGKFDRSSAEFNQKWEEMALHGAALAETPVVYTVGKSDAQT